VKISIETESQEEFDSKRLDLIKAIAGKKLKIKVMEGSTSQTPKEPYFKAQREMLTYWNRKYLEAIRDAKAEIDEIIK